MKRGQHGWVIAHVIRGGVLTELVEVQDHERRAAGGEVEVISLRDVGRDAADAGPHAFERGRVGGARRLMRHRVRGDMGGDLQGTGGGLA